MTPGPGASFCDTESQNKSNFFLWTFGLRGGGGAGWLNNYLLDSA